MGNQANSELARDHKRGTFPITIIPAAPLLAHFCGSSCRSELVFAPSGRSRYVSLSALRKKGAATLLIIGFGWNPSQTCSRPTALSANRRSDTSAASPASPDVPSDLPASPTRPSPAADRVPAATARDLNPPRYPVKRLYFPRRIRPSLD